MFNLKTTTHKYLSVGLAAASFLFSGITYAQVASTTDTGTTTVGTTTDTGMGTTTTGVGTTTTSTTTDQNNSTTTNSTTTDQTGSTTPTLPAFNFTTFMNTLNMLGTDINQFGNSTLITDFNNVWFMLTGINFTSNPGSGSGNNNNDNGSTTTAVNTTARITPSNVTAGTNSTVDWNGRGFGHEEDVSIILNGVAVGHAHADGGGNFSTGSMQLPSTPGTYAYTFTGNKAENVHSTVTVQ